MDNKKEVKTIEKEGLTRGLKRRHIEMIAIGGSIGVGLFYGSAAAIETAGPSILLAYLAFGAVIFLIMRALGELAIEEPVAGSFTAYAARYITPFTGWYMVMVSILMAISVGATEFIALSQYLKYWWPDCPTLVGPVLLILIITTINLSVVKNFGEVEFWMSIIKVATIIGIIVLGLGMVFFGLGNNGTPMGISNLYENGGFFPNGLSGFVMSLTFVAFSFWGVEFVGVTAGESETPKVTIPRAINGVAVRILLFYIGALFVILCIFNWKEIGLNGSPFVIVFSQVGIPYAGSIINFVIITAVISSLNSSLYSYSRTAFNLAVRGDAPKILARKNKNNVPVACITLLVSLYAVGGLLTLVVSENGFAIFSSISVFSILFNWTTILISQLRYRKIRIARGDDDKIAFKMPFFPYGNYFAIAVMLLIAVVMAINPGTRTGMIVGPSLFVILLCIYQIKKKVNKSNDSNNIKDNNVEDNAN